MVPSTLRVDLDPLFEPSFPVNRRVTQQDVAQKLGLDKSTVSLALRNCRKLPAATRESVRAMAARLGYRPDPALAILARQRWAGYETGSGAALAYLVDSRMGNAAQHRCFLPAVRARAEERGYFVREFDLADYASVTVIARVLYLAFATLATNARQYPTLSGVLRHWDDIGSTGVDALIAEQTGIHG